MPNGHDRNWVRFCAAVNGFRNRFGRWPSSVRLASKYVDDLRAILSVESFRVLEEKLTLRTDAQLPQSLTHPSGSVVLLER